MQGFATLSSTIGSVQQNNHHREMHDIGDQREYDWHAVNNADVITDGVLQRTDLSFCCQEQFASTRVSTRSVLGFRPDPSFRQTPDEPSVPTWVPFPTRSSPSKSRRALALPELLSNRILLQQMT